MRFIQVSEYGEQPFYRLTGVKWPVFELMIEVVLAARSRRGRPPTLSVEDQLLLTLCYWSEYRSQFHVASSFGVSEATVCRTVKKIENALLKDKRFHLPGKKALYDGSLDLTVIGVDGSEQRVERPQAKKTAPPLLRQEEMPYPKRTNCNRSPPSTNSVRRDQCRQHP